MAATKPSPLGEYLRARRAILQPRDVGVVSLTARRVPGLRRDEVARLAGISQEYYLRLEQGRDRQPSEQVVTALGRALRLDPAGVEHMGRLAQMRHGDLPRRLPPELEAQLDAGLGVMLNQWTNTPTYIMDGNQDVVIVNPLASAMSGGGLASGVNIPLTVFSDAARAAFEDWEETAERTVATLRFNSDPEDVRLQEIVGTLSIRDPEFRRLWARHDARPHHIGEIRQYVDGHGFVSLQCQTLLVPGPRRHVLVAFHAAPGTPGNDALETLRAELARNESVREESRSLTGTPEVA
ncbi:helix-turn-helix transcriptional regulator [Curtobacterium sp. MCBA15_008]|uniref:helix-turn-helix transcriptional regulator n=1 Tax=Curtobacterium sp. MCBA15_008 TaxID=1898736 RepID=UPI0008DE4B62|nr:helix-turn-helix transcriptional regulator [Curtobacterium sp. MCBA15_008]OII06931.1 hypothetical protein BIU96_04995 [Curtobacterium sp. MCBA15_008]